MQTAHHNKKVERWKKPPEGKNILNIDATFDESSGTGGT
jgi:hypothetical protein